MRDKLQAGQHVRYMVAAVSAQSSSAVIAAWIPTVNGPKIRWIRNLLSGCTALLMRYPALNRSQVHLFHTPILDTLCSHTRCQNAVHTDTKLTPKDRKQREGHVTYEGGLVGQATKNSRARNSTSRT